MLWNAQLGSGRIGCGEFERERAVGVLWSWTEKSGGAVRAGAQRGGGSEPGASTLPGGTGSKQLRACTHARGAARAAAALDRGR